MRNRRKLRRYIITYDIVMTVLALISIGLVIFDLVWSNSDWQETL